MASATPLTLYELQRSIGSALSERFPLAVWVSAEISELKVNYSGHCYLDLVEREQERGVTRAQCRAVIWRNNFATLNSYFEAESGQKLCAGLKVLVKAHVSFHEIYGFSLQITDIDPTYTLGEAERERQITISRLQREGVWDMNRSQQLPRVAQRLAIISSANAAGYQDFYQQISSSPYKFDIVLYDSVVQGDGAELSIVEALEQIAASDEEIDAVVIIRGGGSKSDLRCFDSYRIASHVAQFPLPVIAGIGHDKDVSVVDMVAAHTLKTPTAVAVFLIERLINFDAWLESCALTMHDSAVQFTHSHRLKLESFHHELKGAALKFVDNQNYLLKSNLESISTLSKQLLTLQNTKLEGLANSIEIYSPRHLLQVGYAVARLADKAITSVGDLEQGQTIEVELLDGVVESRVEKIRKN